MMVGQVDRDWETTPGNNTLTFAAQHVGQWLVRHFTRRNGYAQHRSTRLGPPPKPTTGSLRALIESNDFLGRAFAGKTLQSFGINLGGYVGFYDPETESHETFSMKGDMVAERRAKIKAMAREARRAVRHGLAATGRAGIPKSARRQMRKRSGSHAPKNSRFTKPTAADIEQMTGVKNQR